MSKDVIRDLLGIPEGEVQAVHDRTSDQLTIVNFGKTVWTEHVPLPRKLDASRQPVHRLLVDALVSAGFQTTGFRREFMRAYFGRGGRRLPSRSPCSAKCYCSQSERAAFYVHGCEEHDRADCYCRTTCVWKDARDFENLWDTFKMVPDAFLVLPEHRLLVVVEVDVTHSPPRDKYEDVWWWLDCESWSLCTIHVDRYGNVSTPHEYYDAHRERLVRDEPVRVAAM